MIRRELYVDEFKSEIAICDDSDSYSSDEVITESIDSVDPGELLHNQASLEPLC